MTTELDPVVLIVEDEPDVAETYRIWLDEDYDVRIATDGAEATETVDDDVDVVLLDRMLPKKNGTEVLEEIRGRNLDCRVAMVSAVDPDFDVVEMGFDEYVTKPPSRAEIRETIDRLLERANVDDELQEYYSLVARRAALEAEKTERELEESEAYDRLCERIENQQSATDDALGDMSSDTDFVGAVKELSPDGTEHGGDDS